MSAFSALKQFFSPTQDGWGTIDDPFVQVDRAELSRQLDPEGRGTARGSSNQPPTSLVAYDDVETDIITAINEFVERTNKEAAKQIRAYELRLHDLKLLHQLAEIRSAKETALGDFKAKVLEWNLLLSNKKEAIRDSYQELRVFRLQNGLERPPRQIPSKIIPFSELAFAWLLEAAFNSFFLKINDDLGLLGGIIAAAVIAALNVLIGFAVGQHVLPNVNHTSIARKAIGFCGLGIWVAFVVGWNLLASHFRDAKSAGVSEPEAAALRDALAQPFAFDSIYSIGLFVIGVLAAVVAAHGGYTSDDPYPGYGSIGRRHDDRCDEYADDIIYANGALSEIRDDAIATAHEVKSELGQQLRERKRIHSAYGSFCRRYSEHFDHLEHVANNLLARYRLTNQEARTTDAPEHFERRWEIRRSALPELADEAITDGDVQRTEAALDEAVSAITEAFQGSIGSFQTLDSLRQELANG